MNLRQQARTLTAPGPAQLAVAVQSPAGGPREVI